MSGRYTVLALAGARTPWLALAARWANEGSLPVELVPCVSSSEVVARLGLGRQWSALLLDASLPTADRDLVARAHEHGAAVVAVGAAVAGCDATIDADLTRHELLDALAQCATPLGHHVTTSATVAPSWQSPVVGVLGPGGAGSSVVAMAIAQGLAAASRHGAVLLADLALRADQAMLHDARDWTTGLQELVELHRRGTPTVDEVRASSIRIERRGYDLLCGLRRARAWPAVRPQAFSAAFRSLRSAWDVIVCDSDADLEGARDGGSVDVEERNVMARTTCSDAAVVVVVGAPGLKGVHSLVRALDDVVELRGATTGVIAVMSRAPARGRSGLTAAVVDLGPPLEHDLTFAPEVAVERALLDACPLPKQLVSPLTSVVSTALAAASRVDATAEPEPVRPGSLGLATAR